MVPHHVRHLPTGADRPQDLGLGVLRGVRGSVPGSAGHLGAAGGVSGAAGPGVRGQGSPAEACVCLVSRRIEDCQTADEFYSTMGGLTQEMLEQNLLHPAQLMQVVAASGGAWPAAGGVACS